MGIESQFHFGALYQNVNEVLVKDVFAMPPLYIYFISLCFDDLTFVCSIPLHGSGDTRAFSIYIYIYIYIFFFFFLG